MPKYIIIGLLLMLSSHFTQGLELSENAEITLLYASLIEAYTYRKGDPNLMQMYNQRYAEGITRLKNLGEAQEVVDEYRYGQIRKPRT